MHEFYNSIRGHEMKKWQESVGCYKIDTIVKDYDVLIHKRNEKKSLSVSWLLNNLVYMSLGDVVYTKYLFPQYK